MIIGTIYIVAGVTLLITSSVVIADILIKTLH